MDYSIVFTICLTLDTALIALAAPLLARYQSMIGGYVSPFHLKQVLALEFPFQNINKKYKNFNWLNLSILLALLAFIPIIIDQPAPSGYTFLIGSGHYLLLLTTTFLTTTFIFAFAHLQKMNNNEVELFEWLVKKFTISQSIEARTSFALALTDYGKEAIRRQDQHLEQDLYRRLETIFTEAKVSSADDPLEFEQIVYQIISVLALESYTVSKKEVRNRLSGLEYMVSSNSWMWPQGLRFGRISRTNFHFAWRNLLMMVEYGFPVHNHWGVASQFFDINLQPLYEGQKAGDKEVTKDETEEREHIRYTYLEFHYALGGLLLFTKQYDNIVYCFRYSQQIPPRFPLLPESMTAIFKALVKINDQSRYNPPLEDQYPFPNIDNLGLKNTVSNYISRYLALLFIRQYHLTKTMVYQNFTGLPILPEKRGDLLRYEEIARFFKKQVKLISHDFEKLFEKLQYRYPEAEIDDFFHHLHLSIDERLKEIEVESTIDQEKKENFISSSKQILYEAIDQYLSVQAKKPINGPTNAYFPITGSAHDFPRLSFITDGTADLNAHSILAESVRDQNLFQFIPLAFNKIAAQRFLIKSESLIEALNKIGFNERKHLILGFGISFRFHDIKQLLGKRDLPSRSIQDVIFIIPRDQLPYFEFTPPSKQDIKEYNLRAFDTEDSYKLHYSFSEFDKVGLDTQKRFRKDEEDDLSKRLFIMLWLNLTIHWPEGANVLQLDLISPKEERGVPIKSADLPNFFNGNE